MARIIRCECGFVAHGDTDELVIDAIREHMRADHPELLETVRDEDLLGWIMIGAGLVMLTIGGLWLRSTVRIRF